MEKELAGAILDQYKQYSPRMVAALDRAVDRTSTYKAALVKIVVIAESVEVVVNVEHNTTIESNNRTTVSANTTRTYKVRLIDGQGCFYDEINFSEKLSPRPGDKICLWYEVFQEFDNEKHHPTTVELMQWIKGGNYSHAVNLSNNGEESRLPTDDEIKKEFSNTSELLSMLPVFIMVPGLVMVFSKIAGVLVFFGLIVLCVIGAFRAKGINKLKKTTALNFYHEFRLLVGRTRSMDI
ncbi:hypothetical protein [Vogesella indigofera]|uniref:hypothetical protein n=1 Tax=Vogesella indigofera TaxID=45465 RepID=UPI00234F0F06|nr:hypothetical protein [Vogesella indigofera]MDC7706474.1 hypothetical protein [Vogesella indigofera]